MAYVILVNNDNTLSAPKKQRIMQRSKLFDTLYFLVAPIYEKQDMSSCTVLLEYLLPVSKKYRSEILSLNDDRYEEFLKYTLPFDTNLTSEAGEVQMQLSFIHVDLDVEGKPVQKVRKTSSISINIIPIKAWADIVPDEALSALDQRIIMLDSQIKAVNDMNDLLNDTKADNIIYEDNKLQLTANGNKIGNSVDIGSHDDCCEDGVPVVDFNNSDGLENPDDSTNKDDGINDNVVEFDPMKSRNLNNVIEF